MKSNNPGFTKIPNSLIYDIKLSSDAKFLYTWMCSKPNDWRFFNANIMSELKWGKAKLSKVMSELCSSKWVTRNGQCFENGRLGNVVYVINRSTYKREVDKYNSLHIIDSINKKYKDSDKNLYLGMDYKSFLKTWYWRAISRHIRYKHDFTCYQCGKKGGNLHVHHLSYEHHGEEHRYLEDLVLLCDNCHKEIHNK